MANVEWASLGIPWNDFAGGLSVAASVWSDWAMHSFIAYIDESGDDGLTGKWRVPGRGGGSSHWLSIGAVVWRLSRDLDFVSLAKSILSNLPEQKRRRPLHFSELEHSQRVMAVSLMARQPFRLVCVLANKKVIPPGVYKEKNQLYHYTCRYLIERISWLCRDLRKDVPEGDGRVKLVFARRGGMSYPDFRNYLDKLRASNDKDIRIHWPVIDIEGVEAYDQSERYGLQLADLAVSGLNWGLEPDFYGNFEPRYATIIKPNVYHRNGNYFSYGCKIVPPVDRLPLESKQADFIRLFGSV